MDRWRVRRRAATRASAAGGWSRPRWELLGSGRGSAFGGVRAVSFFEDEVFAALGEPLGDDLSIERVGEDLGPFFEGARVARDRATVRAPDLFVEKYHDIHSRS